MHAGWSELKMPSEAAPSGTQPSGIASPAERRMTLGRGWSEAIKQTILVGLAVLLYFAVRGQTEGSESAALENGRRVLDFERGLNIAYEQDVQSAFSSHIAVTLSNWAYIWLHWPVIAITLIWLHRKRRYDYLLLRNAMFISGAIGLVFFIFFPVTPPRLLGPEFIDTITEHSTSYRVLQPPGLVNQHAAVPSLHVGWNLLVGITLLGVTRNRLVRSFAVTSPILMMFAVVATANHYVLDAVAGSVVALIGLSLANLVTLPLAQRTEPSGRRHEAEVVEDHAVDPTGRQPLEASDVLDSPTEHESLSP